MEEVMGLEYKCLRDRCVYALESGAIFRQLIKLSTKYDRSKESTALLKQIGKKCARRRRGRERCGRAISLKINLQIYSSALYKMLPFSKNFD